MAEPDHQADYQDLEREPYLYLVTRGRKTGRPREIEIWFTHCEGRFYVIAEYPTSHWVQNLRVHSEVRVKIAENSFAAQARILSPETEPERLRAVKRLSQEKYGWGDGLVVELIPRTGTSFATLDSLS